MLTQNYGLVHYARKPLDAPNGSYKAHQFILQAIHELQVHKIPYEHVWEEAREMEHLVLPEEVAQALKNVLTDCGFSEVLVEPASIEFYDRWKHHVDKMVDGQERPKGFMPAPLAAKLKELDKKLH